ncbi:glucans biosynthesis protein [Rubripirellula lacrimiformis]|uniref:Glucans biosynthesis protein n=1 Tax=Rubripirellula lacrimiformis TaxID=1930273 RepID=A0A517NAY7_9BACT|nr:acyltransferase family protein [Rubripirellula lacrimiformis]QDT04290.1 glucans biosynthesis protein [Rubripirellula lacrimiformis]
MPPTDQPVMGSIGNSGSETTFAGLDLVRAAAAIAVVALHAGVPYLKHPMPGLGWTVQDTPSEAVDFAFWSLELIVMPLFLVIAGFFTWRSLGRSQPSGVVRSRAKRLLIPLLFGMLVVLPLDLYLWVLGWVTDGAVPMVKMKSLKFDGSIDRNLWGLSHLWFLPYLFTYVAILAAAKAAWDRWGQRTAKFGQGMLRQIQPGSRTIDSICIAALAGAASIVLIFRPEVVWGFQHAFLPVASKWTYHAIFFALGVSLAWNDPQLDGLKRWAPRLAIPTLMMGFATIRLGQWQLLAVDPSPISVDLSSQMVSMQIEGEYLFRSNLSHAITAVMTATTAVLATLVIMGLAMRHVLSVSTAVKYVAAASFWIYLVHHPILGLAHIDLKWFATGFSPVAKMIFAATISVAFSIATYEGLVRRTRLGKILGFQYSLPSERSDAATGQQLAESEIENSPTIRRDEDESDATISIPWGRGSLNPGTQESGAMDPDSTNSDDSTAAPGHGSGVGLPIRRSQNIPPRRAA